jgi:hypothetical protein
MSKIVRRENKNEFDEKTKHFKLYIDLPENSMDMTSSEMFNMLKSGLINLKSVKVKVMPNRGFKEQPEKKESNTE